MFWFTIPIFVRLSRIIPNIIINRVIAVIEIVARMLIICMIKKDDGNFTLELDITKDNNTTWDIP
ncbi:MAG: hypothetical protein COA71_11325 [SAR86 cluster bacterium]|uniref:Uncharacterized protein n=1 Tax=SAR86 cluster bacterium TaxID=2030880 RepID=A0A2A5CAC0_9GAMM|nr:MAG: hypothetical protein COA71_11325 [SAR86 cluster bacterium]